MGKYTTRIYGHRGASEYAPENTMEAFVLAYEMGADGIELDVQMSKDGYLVVMHDETVDRVSGVHGEVKNMTLDELKSLNINKMHPEYSKCRVPLLEEVLNYFKDKDFLFNFELKNSIWHYDNLEEKVLETVNRYGVLDRTIFSSFNHSSMLKMKNLEDEAKVAFLTSEVQTNVLKYLHNSGVNIYHPAQYLLQGGNIVEGEYEMAEVMNTLHKSCIQVNTWTVNRGSVMRKLCDCGVDGIITNKPDLGSEIRDDA